MFVKFFQFRKNIILATLLLAFFAFPKNVFAENLFSVGSGASVLTATSSAIFANISNTSPASTFMLMLQKAGNELFKVDTFGNVTLQGTLTMPNSPLTTSISAANITSGEFGSVIGAGGNYVFGSTVPGNVGIGITPTVKLHVQGNGTTAAAFMNGNVGIGTTNPNTNLELAGSGATIRLSDSVSKTPAIEFLRGAGDFGSDVWGDYKIQNIGSHLSFIGGESDINNGNPVTYMTLSATGNLTVSGTGNSSFAGKVGVGTIAPYAGLEIANTGIIGSANYAYGLLIKPSNTGLGARFAFTSGVNPEGSRKVVLMGESSQNLGDFTILTSANANLPAGTGTFSNRFIIQNSGNVGIGSSTPSAKLTVAGGNIFVTDAQITSATPHAVITKGYLDAIVYPSSTPSVGTQSGFWTAGAANSIYNNNIGNVGIGTTDPVAKLDVNSTTLNDTLLKLNSPNNRGFIISSYNNGTIDDGGVDFFKTSSLGDFRFRNSSRTLLFLKNDGNVGIGTTAPRAKLEVNGDILVPNGQSVLSRDSGDNVSVPLFKFVGDTLSIGNWEGSYVGGTYIKGGNGSVFTDFSAGNNANFIVRKVSGATPTELMRVNVLGNVGIGTPSPSVRLDLGGGTAGRITGLDTAPAAVRGDSEAVPKKWIVDNFASAIGIRKSFNFTNTNNVQYYLIARLPAENSSYAEGLMIETTGHTSSTQGKGKLTVSLGQRSGFWYTKNYENNPRVHVVVYKNVDGTSNVYVYTPAANYTSGDVLYYQFGWKSGFVLYDDPVASTTVPSGTLIFDSNDDVTYPVNDSLMTGKGIFLNNVGIGTLSPSVRLDLGGGTLGRITGLDTAPAAVRGDSEAVPKKWIVDNFAPSSIVGSASLWATSTAGIYNVGLGNVGIGTTNPVNRMHIRGIDPVLYIQDTETSLASTKSFIKFSESDGIGDTERTWRMGNDSNEFRLAYSADDNNGVGVYGDLLTVLTTGNVGIGTTAPSVRLDLGGGTAGRITGLDTAPAAVRGDSEAVPKKWIVDNFSPIAGSGPNAALTGNGTANYVPLWTGAGTLGNSSIYNAATNVGIGTTAPGSYRLNVNGNSYFDGNANITGGLVVDTPTDYSATVVTSLTSAPIQVPAVNVGTTAAFLPFLNQNASYSSGYITHMNLGLYKGTSGWGEGSNGFYVALGGNDSNPTEHYKMTYGGNITYSGAIGLNAGGTNQNVILTPSGTGYTILKGFVGIGTIAPSVRLDLGGGTAGRITGLDTAPAAVRGDSEAVPKKWIVDNFAPAIGGASLWATSTSGIYNVGLGNIGIGTSKPGAKLEVLHVNTSTDPDTSNYPLKLYNNTWTGNQVTGIEFWNGSSKVVPTSRIVSRMNGSGNGGENLYLQTQSSSLTNPNPNQPTTKLTILADGNVGMGTQNPSVRLDLGGGAAGRITGLDTSPAAVRGDSEAVPKKWIVDNFAPSSIVGSASLWATSTSGTYNVGLVNVGIGTTNPTAKLHVNGTSIFSDSAYIPKIGSPTLYTGSAKVDLGYFTMIGGQRREIRITAGETGSDVINGVFKIRVVGDTGSVATRSYIEKTIYISTYVSPGRIYGQRSYISDAMQSDDFRISNFIYDSGTNEIVLSVWYMGSGSRGADISFDYLGKNSSSFLNATVSNLITYTPGEEPAREIVSIAPDTNFFIHNNVGIGTTAPSVRLDLGGGAAGRITGLDTSPAAVRGDSEAVPKKWIVDNFSPIAGPGAALTGSGTANYVPLWTGTGSLGTSTIYQNGGNVGIGITSPSQALDIFGKLKLTSGGVIFNANSQYRLDLAAVYTNSLLTPGGAGIGTTNPLGMVGVLQGMSNYNTAFTAPHLALTAGSAVDNTGFVGITYGASTSANYGWSSGALRSTNGQSDFVWKYHDNNAVGIERLRITKEGFVGIGTSTPSVMLDVAGAAKIGGDLNMSGKDITNVNKLTVATIDPLYRINGVNYSSFAASLVGGVKEEYLGRVKISKRNSAKEYEYRLDFSKIEKGSDLWVWRQTVDFSPENVEVSITPYGAFANTYYFVENNAIILRADKAVDVSYRLSGKRHDWQAWPTRANDQLESPSFIINNGKVIK